MKKPMPALIAALLLATAAHLDAQGIPPTLMLNGQVDAAVAVGSNLEVSVDATPGALVYVAFNVNPGPTFALGMTLPIAVDSGLLITHDGLPIPMNGHFSDNLPVRAINALEGLKVYGLAITFDPTLPPFGFGFSNGATVTFTRAPSAGPDTAGAVNEGVTLDGSGSLAIGPLPSGFGVSWAITSGPVGHAAQLAGADTLFPTLLADIEGTYDVTCSLLAPGTTGGNGDVCQVQVHRLDVTSHQHGQFAPGSMVNFAANLFGPAATSFEVPGIATGMGGSISGSASAGTPLTQLTFEVQSGNGQHFARGLSVINNAGSAPGMPTANSAAFHLRQPIFDAFESVIEMLLQQIDLSGAITAIPPIQIPSVPGPFGTTLFSATIQPTSFTYDPMVDLEITAQASGMNVSLTFNNVVLMFNMNGLLFNAPYNTVGTLTMTSINVNFDMVTTVSGGQYMTMAVNPQATITGANLTFTSGIPSNFATLLLGGLLPVIQTTFAQGVAAIFPPVFDQVLNAIPQTIDLTGSGVPLVIDLLPGGIFNVAGGVTFALNAGAHAMPPSPASAPVLGVYTTPNPPPNYTGTSPIGGAPYITAAAIGDDLLNSLFTASMQAGLLELDLTTGLDIGGQQIPSNAGGFELIFPGVGFASFDPMAVVHLRVHPTIAPIAQVGAPSGETLLVTISDLVVDVTVEVATGYEATVLSIGLNGQVGVNVMYNTMTMSLDLAPGTASATAYVRGTLPGVDASSQVQGLASLFGTILPGLLGGVVSIPVPAIDLSALGIPVMGTLIGLEIDGPASDFLSLFFN